MADKADSYDAGSIESLEGLAAIRERPGMYIGNTNTEGFHHLVFEVLDNSIDEALAGFCDEISVTLSESGARIEDNGRGIPVSEMDDGVSAVEKVMTEVHAGGKFDADAYETSGGLHGVGVSVVNALSDTLTVEIRRDGHLWHQEYTRGNPGELTKKRQLADDEETGTVIEFEPNTDIFEVDTWDTDIIRKRVKNLAFLNPGVKIQLRNTVEETRDVFEYSGGIREFVSELNTGKDEIHSDVMYFEGEDTARGNHVAVEAAVQFTDSTQSSDDSLLTFANNIQTVEGGSHLTGFKSAITRTVKKYANEENLLGDVDDDDTLKGTHVREGLTAVLSVKHTDPQFEGQTKTKLGNTEVEGVVSSVVSEQLYTYLINHQQVAKKIVNKAIQAYRAEKAAKKEAKIARRKNSLETTALPGKLTDCQTPDPSDSELFIVEGDSAGGSARMARNPENQAVLPLGGKILNVFNHRDDKALGNSEIENLVTAIGAGFGSDFDISDVRYEKIIILTDADVDGAHIRTLILTFFYKYMRPLIENGCVYAAQPPLYRIKCGGETYDAMDEQERDEIVANQCGGSPNQVQRFKGLGEMNPQQLAETVMDPENRILRRLQFNQDATSGGMVSVDQTFTTLMGDSASDRRDFIQEKAGDEKWVDI